MNECNIKFKYSAGFYRSETMALKYGHSNWSNTLAMLKKIVRYGRNPTSYWVWLGLNLLTYTDDFLFDHLDPAVQRNIADNLREQSDEFTKLIYVTLQEIISFYDAMRQILIQRKEQEQNTNTTQL